MRYTIYPARPVAHHRWTAQGWGRIFQFRRALGMTSGGFAVLVLGVVWMAQGPMMQGAAATPSRAHVGKAPSSWLRDGTLLTVYGRGFGTAPILGPLGTAHSLDDLGRLAAPYTRQIQQLTGHRGVRIAIHLIYGMATPCRSLADTCLLYLDDDAGVDIVHEYIEPAARRGWLVILDDQLGRSTPVQEMQRLRDKGYLSYDNVEVAFDPEFQTTAEQAIPGNPPGQVAAAELNAAERVMDESCGHARLAHRKLLLVHQWTPSMILDRDTLVSNRRYVQPAVVMDGIGPADEKAGAYTTLLHNGERGVLPGIKLFFPNKYDPSGYTDLPLLTWRQLFGRAPVQSDNGTAVTIHPVPRVVVIS